MHGLSYFFCLSVYLSVRLSACLFNYKTAYISETIRTRAIQIGANIRMYCSVVRMILENYR